ncbi:MAG: hypothetical protein JHC33_12900 [Ignisphaera sp.]|nr:hypothetical protein [Ignisphaera sp.]
MPSHEIHKLCARIFDLSEHASSYVDSLIDSGTCFVHDIGLEDALVVAREGEEEARPVLGIHALLYCLYRDGRVGEEHLKVFIIHMLLDCVDRKMHSHLRKDAIMHKVIQQCIELVENRLNHSLTVLAQVEYRSKLFLPLPPETLAPLIQKLLMIFQKVTRIEKEKLVQCVEVMLRHY